ncbi:hypothetical protein SSX86_019819 [Deinandra increscens subsp. villosa]|uniref:Reverse transcriptase domain-containing protein n=1 Tax=Deinandra increscens subsp. villosa TaxID=3103831 RepID=A0AAP0CV02_9ASTR
MTPTRINVSITPSLSSAPPVISVAPTDGYDGGGLSGKWNFVGFGIGQRVGCGPVALYISHIQIRMTPTRINVSITPSLSSAPPVISVAPTDGYDGGGSSGKWNFVGFGIDAQDILAVSALWEPWFSKLAMWRGQSFLFERVAWIKVSGVPPELWDKKIFDLVGGSIGKVCHSSEADLEDGDLSGDFLGVVVSSPGPVHESRTLSWMGKKFRVSISEVFEDWRPDFLNVQGSVATSSEDLGGARPVGGLEQSPATPMQGGSSSGGDLSPRNLEKDNHVVPVCVGPGVEVGNHVQMCGQDHVSGGDLGVGLGPGGSLVQGSILKKRDRPKSLSPSQLSSGLSPKGSESSRGSDVGVVATWRPLKSRAKGVGGDFRSSADVATGMGSADVESGKGLASMDGGGASVPVERQGGEVELEDEVQNTILVGAGVGVQLEDFEDLVREEDGKKVNWIHQLKLEHKVKFLCIQETKAQELSSIPIRQIWGNSAVEFEGIEAQGRSGGILSLWDPASFRLVNCIKRPNFLLTSGQLAGGLGVLNVVNIYAPQDIGRKRALWCELLDLLESTPGMWVIAGDFNEVRSQEERRFSTFNQVGAQHFNEFISDAGLLEYRMGGSKYTFSYGNGKNFSKLDRFLVCHEFFSRWPNAEVTALPRLWSDHSPILLRVSVFDFGPVPFRFFSSCLKNEELVGLIRSSLLAPAHGSRPPDLVFMDKLRAVKRIIKDWRMGKKMEESREMEDLVSFCLRMDRCSEERVLDEQERELWISKKKRLGDLEMLKILDLRQKARVKWAVEGDENSAFFHGYINSNRACGRISGLWVDDVWTVDPSAIKEVVPQLCCEGIRTISDEVGADLVRPFTKEEIKVAVWDCDGDKAPGPDGFNFDFLKFFWAEVEEDIFRIMSSFHETGSISNGCGSSFIHLIPKCVDAQKLGEFRPISLLGCISKIISKVLAMRMKGVLDSLISKSQMGFVAGRYMVEGPLIINEVISWLKYRKIKGLIFKIDFRKAYDYLDWGFLDPVLEQMNFPWRWRFWVSGILKSARASVLVNGSPTKEFQCFRGVRQGDHLSPYLFLIAMEALNWMICRADALGIFNGIQLPSGGPKLTHLFYADDAMIMGEWSLANVLNLSRILRCFYFVSGLKVNFHKSALYGINVGQDEVKGMADKMNCVDGSLPFVYLGMKVGANMNRRGYWHSVVEIFQRRLSRWKAKTLSLGGRLTLIKSVLDSLPTFFFSLFRAPKSVIEQLERIRFKFLWGGVEDKRKIHWVRREDICKPKCKGGLGLCNLEDFNLSLICKWLWRYKVEGGKLWKEVIDAIHGGRRDNSGFFPCNNAITGVWKTIVKVNMGPQRDGLGLDQWIVESNGGWAWSGGGTSEFSPKVVRELWANNGGEEPGADVDGNGVLEYGEFVAMTIYLQKMENDEHLRRVFMFF